MLPGHFAKFVSHLLAVAYFSLHIVAGSNKSEILSGPRDIVCIGCGEMTRTLTNIQVRLVVC